MRHRRLFYRICTVALIALGGCGGGEFWGAGPRPAPPPAIVAAPTERAIDQAEPGQAPIGGPGKPDVRPDRACHVIRGVVGGLAGFLVGGWAGGLLEQAIYEGEDAGLTGALVGGMAGAILGAKLARRACGGPHENVETRAGGGPQS